MPNTGGADDNNSVGTLEKALGGGKDFDRTRSIDFDASGRFDSEVFQQPTMGEMIGNQVWPVGVSSHHETELLSQRAHLSRSVSLTLSCSHSLSLSLSLVCSVSD